MRRNNALFEYNDKSDAIQLNNEFKTLLQPAAYTWNTLRNLKYLENFGSRPADSEDFVWTKETFRLKPVVSLTHLTIYRHAGRTELLF